MDWRHLRWPCSLDEPPVVRQFSIYRQDHPPGFSATYRLNLWSLHLYRYSGEQTVKGIAVPIRPGYGGVTPPGLKLGYRFDEQGVHASAHFRVRRVPKERATHFIPVMQPLGDDFERLYALIEEAIAVFPSQPARASACLWCVLWRLADAGREPAITGDGAGTGAAGLHPAVRQALEMIELRLGERIGAADVVAHAGVSHNHLNRLFVSQLGDTIGGHITRRRVERARHLLVETTIPVKEVAIEVGIPDPHLFNKTVRKILGAAPTKIRAGALGAGGRA